MTTKGLAIGVAALVLGGAISSVVAVAQQNVPIPGYSPQGTVTGVKPQPPGRPQETPTTGPTGAPISPGGISSHATDVGGPGNVGPSPGMQK